MFPLSISGYRAAMGLMGKEERREYDKVKGYQTGGLLMLAIALPACVLVVVSILLWGDV